MRSKIKVTIGLISCLVTIPAAAQQPLTVNARVVSRSAGTNLPQALGVFLKEQTDAAWVGYTVPAVPGDGTLRNDGWSERCRLEQGNLASGSNSPSSAGPAGPVRLEPSGSMMVLFRVQNHEIQKLRTLSTDCQIDAGGLTFAWFEAVTPAQSVAFLKTLAADPVEKTRSEPALAAIALHRDAAATAALFDLATTGTTRIRERALFWIARRAESKAAATISAAIERDPDVEVKKQAGFALSQLPRQEGVPLLINLARTSQNPAVRKQAYFWLGQSKDPRALAFFEEILR